MCIPVRLVNSEKGKRQNKREEGGKGGRGRERDIMLQTRIKTIQKQSPMRTRCSLLLWPASLLTGQPCTTNSLFDHFYEADEPKCELLSSARLPRLKCSTPVSSKSLQFLQFPHLLSSQLPQKRQTQPLQHPQPSSQPDTAEAAGAPFPAALEQAFWVGSGTAPAGREHEATSHHQVLETINLVKLENTSPLQLNPTHQ